MLDPTKRGRVLSLDIAVVVAAAKAAGAVCLQIEFIDRFLDRSDALRGGGSVRIDVRGRRSDILEDVV